MHVLIPESILPDAIERLLLAGHTVHYEADLVQRPDDLLAIAPGAEAIIVRRLTQVRGPLLSAMNRCKAVGRLGVGLDNIDVQTCKARGIEVIPATGENARSVAEYVVGAAFVLVRGAFRSTEAVIDGKWPKAALNLGGELSGRTMGIIGFGSIGRVTAALAQAVGMRVIVHDSSASASSGSPDQVALNELLVRSDVVTVHVPLLPATRNLINAERLAMMKPSAVLINAARGGIVDEVALLDALRAGRLAGAALDAFEDEPLGHSPQYAGVPNLVLTPHIAGVTRESERRVTDLVVSRVLDVLARR